MKPGKDFKIGVALLISGFLGLTLVQGSCMHFGMMGNRGDMKTMMQQNMGDQLPPPGLTPDLLPEPNSEGVKLLSEYCTQCHDLPAPGLHSATEWPAVVERMNKRMPMMGNRGMMGMMHNVQVPSATELKTIVDYLQQNGTK